MIVMTRMPMVLQLLAEKRVERRKPEECECKEDEEEIVHRVMDKSKNHPRISGVHGGKIRLVSFIEVSNSRRG